MARALPLIALIALLALAGCGSSSSSSSSSSSGSSGSSGTSSPSVSMKNIQFDPKSTTVKVGQKVTWTNDDAVDHNVTATGGASFKSKDFGQGGTFSFTPKKAGEIKYTCTLHPGMDGTLTVK
jgi:plastocyanin